MIPAQTLGTVMAELTTNGLKLATDNLALEAEIAELKVEISELKGENDRLCTVLEKELGAVGYMLGRPERKEK